MQKTLGKRGFSHLCGDAGKRLRRGVKGCRRGVEAAPRLTLFAVPTLTLFSHVCSLSVLRSRHFPLRNRQWPLNGPSIAQDRLSRWGWVVGLLGRGSGQGRRRAAGG